MGGQGGYFVHPCLGRSVNPISTSGAHYAYYVHAPPDFQTLRRPCELYLYLEPPIIDVDSEEEGGGFLWT